MFIEYFWRTTALIVVATLVLANARSSHAQPTLPSQIQTLPLLYKVQAANQDLEIAVNGSRILELDQKVRTVQVSNPDLLEVTPLSATRVQLHAKKQGITEVNLWDMSDKMYTIQVVVKGDVRELMTLLRTQFPTATVNVVETRNNTAILTGFADGPQQVAQIYAISKDFYANIHNNLVIGGGQEVLLHVKVMEVSRTKLRELGIDFGGFSGSKYGVSTVGGLVSKASSTADLARSVGSYTTVGAETLQVGILDGLNGFVGICKALQQDNLLKVLAEPTLVTVSGRPAYFQSGGEVPYPQPTGFGNISVAFRPYGVQVDFVPIVLGSGKVRLEVRPRVSEIDPTLTLTINGTTVPGFRTREADTGVVMQFGQAMAIGGLLQFREESEKRAVPFLGQLPYLGIAFRRVENKTNEVELLIVVQPELVVAVDPCELPPCGPGMNSASPSNKDLYFRGYMEVPTISPNGRGGYAPNPASGEEVPPGVPLQMYNPTQGNTYSPSNEALPTPSPLLDAQTSATRPRAVGKPAPAPQRTAKAASSRRAPLGQVTISDNPTEATNNRSQPRNRQNSSASQRNSSGPGLIGPIGYDLRN